MTYNDTVTWMFKQLPMYQNLGKKAYKKDLYNTILLDKYLRHPHKNFHTIHVGGTNGKGSTSHMIASVLQEAGYKVGLYTSPHLKDFRERIKINGKSISKQFVTGFVKNHKPFFEKHQLSFFEMTVGIAFDYFSKKKVDIAVIEVGLGGRLDSTNIITPIVSVITNIGMDHTEFLGNTLEKIANEKAGIIKESIPVVIGETQEETKPVFIKVAKQNLSSIVFADKKQVKKYDSDLKGGYQEHNLKTAVVTLNLIRSKGYNISGDNINNGLKRVTLNTGLKGRWHIVQESPKIVLDTAHNKEGLVYVFDQIKSEAYEELHIVFGVVKDKDLTSILPLLPKGAQYYCCKPNVPRGKAANELHDILVEKGLSSQYFNSVHEAFNTAKKNASTKDFIYVGGSTFVVAEVV